MQKLKDFFEQYNSSLWLVIKPNTNKHRLFKKYSRLVLYINHDERAIFLENNFRNFALFGRAYSIPFIVHSKS